jgi:hypothetical protein
LHLEFEADRESKVVYPRSLRLVETITGADQAAIDVSSPGGDMYADGQVAGALAECLQFFWDMGKLR